jgi:hypothetical protein
MNNDKHIAPGCLEHEHKKAACARCGATTLQCENKTEAVCNPCKRKEQPAR